MAGMTADDINKLQVIQNSPNRLLTGARKGTHNKDLLERTDIMSMFRKLGNQDESTPLKAENEKGDSPKKISRKKNRSMY